MAEMTSPKNFIYIVGASAFLASGASALAQTPTQADQLKLAYQAGRNQLGILSYCNDKGFVGTDVLDIQKKLLGMVPVPADKSGGDSAEAQGRTGTIAAWASNRISRRSPRRRTPRLKPTASRSALWSRRWAQPCQNKA
ncbi:hypothetical protein [Bosea vaviloviae]|uniref:hypothetical protein n=1 Tax=Bosea vaviloviae TaxID=1526658 RepID=UPI001314D894|nr:hypothetical protein [Bosea vaviloviae]